MAIHEDAHTVLLPAFDGLTLSDATRRCLDRGGVSILLGESRAEYVARRMSDERKASESVEAFRRVTAEARSRSGMLLTAVDQEPAGICRLEGLVPAFPGAESLRKMAEWSNGHFEPVIFQAFVKSIGIYPIGSLVLLSCGRLGVVTEQGGKSLLTPHVKVFFSTRAQVRIAPQVVDLAQPACKLEIVSREDPAKWNFPDLDEIWSGLAGVRN